MGRARPGRVAPHRLRLTVASLTELARRRTGLAAEHIDHLQRLVGSWALLADLAYADLLLHAPVSPGGDEFVVIAHVRSGTADTCHHHDPVGRVLGVCQRPLLQHVYRDGRAGEGLAKAGDGGPDLGDDDVVQEDVTLAPAARLVIDYVPVRSRDRVVAVLTCEAEPAFIRHQSGVRHRYRELFDRIAAMIQTGEFPYERFERSGEFREPRVGDGVLVIDREARVEYASPNATSALHRLGCQGVIDGRRLDEMGIDDTVVRRAVTGRGSSVGELERDPDLTVALRCYPILDAGRVTGVVALMRDVSELRRRDRLLVAKDTIIREMHHRVKNNLQTVSALLRLQARRVHDTSARRALEQAVRRIGCIGVVHETLSLDATDRVQFHELVGPVVRLVEEGLGGPDPPLRVAVQGSLGEVAGDVAMPLALGLTELLQNAVDHGGAGASVEVALHAGADAYSLRVVDTGPGVPDGFSLDRDAGLGLTIVRSFVVHDLGGTMSIRTRSTDQPRGTVIELRVPRERAALPLG